MVKAHRSLNSGAWALMSRRHNGEPSLLPAKLDRRFYERVAKSRLGISAISIRRPLATSNVTRFQENEFLESKERVPSIFAIFLALKATQ